MAMEQALPHANPSAARASVVARHPLIAAAALLLLLSLLLRSAWFGNPLAGYDEQFYLLTGDRMLHGALPYVDIWDRKPLGLFLIYAGLRALGGDGVLTYQLGAATCVALTGLVIMLHVRRRLPMQTALACGALYVLWVGVMGGEAGQSPLFYNLPMALAALLVIEAMPVIGSRAGFVRASAAMALCGIALTVKTTAIFESCFFGLTLVLGLWRSGAGALRTAAAALAWMALGAMPFATIAAWYAAQGHFDAFWFANAASAALRHDGWSWQSLWWLCLTLAPLGPLALLAVAGRRHVTEPETPLWERRFLLGWIVAATIGFGAVGYFFHHYALPVLVPLAIAAGRFLAHSRHARLALVLFALYPATQQLVLNRLLVRDDRADAAAALAALPPEVERECMLLYGGPPILYHLSNACLATPYAFPGHLYLAAETGAIGEDQLGALASALARRPAAIVTERNPSELRRNPLADVMLAKALARDYRLRAIRGWRYFEEGRHELLIWERRR